MAVFSNLEGTMNPSFLLGKNGAVIKYENDSITIKDSVGSKLLPIQVGSPIDDNSALNRMYLNEHPSVIFGTTVPDDSMGEDKNTYFQTDDNGIIDIFAKNNGKWIKSLYINTEILSSTNGADYIGLISGGTLQQAQFYITPEEFGAKGNGTTDDTDALIRCLAYAKTNKIQIQANNNYRITKSFTIDSVDWFGGTITGNGGTMINVMNTKMQYCNVVACYFKFLGGDGRFYFNKFHDTSATAAFLMQSMTAAGTMDFCFNEMYKCKYAVLQQGTGEKMSTGRFSYNYIHDIAGDAIELNVVNSHYTNGLTIDGNIIENVDGSTAPIPLSNWGIGIGVAGSGPYGIEATDDQYVRNFSIKNNRLYNVKQCIHVEMGKHFTIQNNEVYPNANISVGAGLTAAGIITYGCEDFNIDGVTGRLLNDPSVTTRMIRIGWGVNQGKYAGPPINFRISNVYTPESSVEIYTSCSNDWTNETILQNITIKDLLWRGLPSSSKFSNMSCKTIDMIGQHLSTEGEGGGIYTRQKYTYMNWNNCLVLDDCNPTNIKFSKLYVDRIDQSSNSFTVYTEIDGAGHRGPVLIPVTEEYVLTYDEFPGGRYFPVGAVFHKVSGGKHVVTVAGSFFSANEKLKATTVGDTSIKSAGVNWASNQYAKAAGTQIIIPGAGVDGADLITEIARATYVTNSLYTIDIVDPIATATPEGTVLKAAQPITYITIP